ncbi:hypothetical protein [Niabella drilacis]|uniref:Right handed beta helix region n=1 Tax=Niabella drilacis (strain DSM 25811 / CCM 8410 / CCUG 62505 / LMG 26954 / E90) TaxID=1285928 RepID=A0A1G6M093_NIADE|nr:hypothetical protein [Niabella drilacis]SDC48942.1 hypothetical protein SAMN04487894_102518 [Niabella drilacis]
MNQSSKMKCCHLLILLFLAGALTAQAQTGIRSGGTIITYKPGKTRIGENEKGGLLINVSPRDLQKFKASGFVQYSDLGAAGDGKSDDIDPIVATHAVANEQGLAVKANEGATYYIGGKAHTAIIKTTTDFGTARFIIDDTEVQNRNAAIFEVASGLAASPLKGITSLKKNQKKINASFPATSLITVTDTQIKQYIRMGLNQDKGAAQTDIFIVDKNGNIDMNAPIIWDFNTITAITALPIDEEPLRISGGDFTTIANAAESKYTYYDRNIAIKRSNVVVDGIVHRITGEGDHGAPYGGFLNISNCAFVTIKNCVLTGHKTYRTIGSAGAPVSMGTYDISANRALNISFINCRQTNDINDNRYWGIMGSNYCKNILYDGCVFSRFDAHKGVANATIRNSTLGYMGINAIGSGTFLVENSTINGGSLINLRSDYGSTWQGRFIIRNCIFRPQAGKPVHSVLINGSNSGQHDFGYTCYMPEQIIIENLKIEDKNHPADYNGVAVFADFNPKMKDDTYKEQFPYVVTKEVVLQNVTTTSGHALRVSNNPFEFRNVKISNR